MNDTSSRSDRFPEPQPGLSVTSMIRRYLAARPDATPTEVSAWLAKSDIDLSPQAVDSLIAAIKTG
ncbi:MAG: hypothetical protein WDZ59_05740 [Pirellulales bacterium]